MIIQQTKDFVKSFLGYVVVADPWSADVVVADPWSAYVEPQNDFTKKVQKLYKNFTTICYTFSVKRQNQ